MKWPLKKTFTLIEMLIVIVIIGILASALIPRIVSVQGRARDTERKVDVRNIGIGIVMYRDANNSLPPEFLAPTCSTSLYSDFSTSETSTVSLLKGYLTTVPQDPSLKGLSGMQRAYDPATTCVVATDPGYQFTSLTVSGEATKSFIVMAGVEEINSANFFADYPTSLMGLMQKDTETKLAATYDILGVSKAYALRGGQVSGDGGGGGGGSGRPTTTAFVGPSQLYDNVSSYICAGTPARVAGASFSVDRTNCVVTTTSSTDYAKVLKYSAKYVNLLK